MNLPLNTYVIRLIALAVSLAGIVACSEDMPDSPVTLETRTMSFTFSTGTDPSAKEDEGIRTLKLVFVDDQDKIVAIEDLSADQIGQTGGTDPILQGTVELEVNKEAKAVYAFANVDAEKSILPFEQKVGSYLPKNAEVLLKSSLLISKDSPIPMSSYKYDIPEQSGTRQATIVLYRMIAKVEVSITNQTGKAIIVKDLTLGKFQHRNIFLIPYETLKEVQKGNNTITPVFPKDSCTENYFLELKELEKIVSSDTTINQHYYVHESDLGDEYITISATIRGKNNTYTAPTQFTFVRRNDFLKIPLFVSDYNLVAKIREERAPIGGYPYVIEESQPLTQVIDYEIRYGGKIEVELSLDSEESTETGFTLTCVEKSDTPGLIEEENITPDQNNKLTFHATGKTGNATLTLHITRGTKNLTYTINLSRKEIK